MKNISLQVENEILRLSEQGYSSRNIAVLLKICHRTVNLVRKRRNFTGLFSRGGRPRLLSDGDAHLVERLMMTRNARTPKIAAEVMNKGVNECTARRSLRRIGLVSAVKQKKPALSDKNVKARLKFCKDHKTWTIQDWKKVIWSDETKINRFQSDGKEYYWHRSDERVQRYQPRQSMKHGGGISMA